MTDFDNWGLNVSNAHVGTNNLPFACNVPPQPRKYAGTVPAGVVPHYRLRAMTYIEQDPADVATVIVDPGEPENVFVCTVTGTGWTASTFNTADASSHHIQGRTDLPNTDLSGSQRPRWIKGSIEYRHDYGDLSLSQVIGVVNDDRSTVPYAERINHGSASVPSPDYDSLQPASAYMVSAELLESLNAMIYNATWSLCWPLTNQPD